MSEPVSIHFKSLLINSHENSKAELTWVGEGNHGGGITKSEWSLVPWGGGVVVVTSVVSWAVGSHFIKKLIKFINN